MENDNLPVSCSECNKPLRQDEECDCGDKELDYSVIYMSGVADGKIFARASIQDGIAKARTQAVMDFLDLAEEYEGGKCELYDLIKAKFAIKEGV
jgi:hypothetical protein